MKTNLPFKPTRKSNRQSVLSNARNLKMARSAHAYVRGNTLKFYEWLESVPSRSLPEGPAVWICGDCHIGNLGPVANTHGAVEVQIRDFDQTVIGNPAHDLIRLGLSLAMAARSSDLPGVTTARMMEQMIQGYEQAFVSPKQLGRMEQPDAAFTALKEAKRRSWRHLAKERIAGETVSIPLGKRFWPVTKAERRAIASLVESDPITELATALKRRDDHARVELVDAAYWMKGCSSLGRLRYAALLDVGGQAAVGHDLCLIDIKESTKAAAPCYADARMPADDAQRVVEGARHMSPHLGERMAASQLLDRSVFLREFLPQDLKLEISQVSRQEAMKAAGYLAQVVGRAHARQMDASSCKRWHSELARDRPKSLEAPSWLWSSVVELIALHERGYLEHCRRYALSEPGVDARKSA